jgi:signal transduction histidine kinase
MRLRDLRKTTAFRITVLFSALLIGSVLLLFTLVYWQSANLLMGNLDESLLHEARELMATPDDGQALNLEGLIASDPHQDWQGGLFDQTHQVLAGTVTAWPKGVILDGQVHELTGGLPGATPHQSKDMRVVGMTLPNGRILVMARRADEVHEVREVVLRSLSVGLVASVGLALVGGVVMSFSSLRRIEAMHRATAAIVTGDLSRRLPVDGSGDDFDKLAHIVNAMLAEIERLIDDMKAAGDNIAHDLRTPLTKLRSGLEGALRRGGELSAHRAAMREAIAETDQILATFRALLRISEVESGQRRAGFGAVDLVKLVSSATELFEPFATERGLTFRSDIQAAPRVQGDPDLLFEAVANLLDNAVKFTPPGGSILVSLAADGRIAVEDDGPGLPSERRDLLFQRFARGDKARHLPGNGLGLSLVAAVARLHGVVVTVREGAPGCRIEIAMQ